MDTLKRQWPVVVIGDGPAGATAAISLGQHGIETLVVDRWPEVYPLPRACALDDEVYRILARLGLGEAFGEITHRSGGLRLLDDRHRVLSEFDRDRISETTGFPQANMYDQPRLETVLRERLAELPTVSFIGGVEVDSLSEHPDGVDITWTDTSTGESTTVTAQYVLGADGANSMVRPFIGSTMDDLKFNQRWLVVDTEITHDLDQWDGVHQVCSSARAGTYMQVGPTRHRWEFELLDGEAATDFDDIDRLLPFIEPWTGNLPGDQIELVRVTEYTFRAQLADRWQHGRTFLLGDAAHLTPPFIGQGLCAGVRDSYNVSWKIAGVLDRTLSPEVLTTYQAERKPHALHMIRLALSVGLSMTYGGRLGDLARRFVVPALPLIPAVRAAVSDSSTPAYSRSLLVTDSPLAGSWCPNALIEGERLDALIGDRWSIVTRRAVAPSTSGATARAGAVLIDATGSDQLTGWLAEASADAALVRPDGTVMATGPVSDLLATLADTVRRAPVETR